MLKIIIIIHFIYKRLSGHSRTLYRNKQQSSSKMKYTNKVYIKQIKTLQIIRESNFKKVSLQLWFKSSNRCALVQTEGESIPQCRASDTEGPVTHGV